MTAGALMLTANNYTKAITHCQRNQSARDAISLSLSPPNLPFIHSSHPRALTQSSRFQEAKHRGAKSGRVARRAILITDNRDTAHTHTYTHTHIHTHTHTHKKLGFILNNKAEAPLELSRSALVPLPDNHLLSPEAIARPRRLTMDELSIHSLSLSPATCARPAKLLYLPRAPSQRMYVWGKSAIGAHTSASALIEG